MVCDWFSFDVVRKVSGEGDAVWSAALNVI